MDLLKKFLQEKFGSLKVTVKRKEGRKERNKEITSTVENSMEASQKI